MPFIKIKTSCPVSEAQEAQLKAVFGRAIEHVPGKSEAALLLEFEANCHLFLAGRNDSPTAYIEAAVFVNESHAGYAAFTEDVTRAFRDILGIAPDHVFIKFEDITAWSVQGMVIDRSAFR